MPEDQQTPRHISTRSASTGHSASLDTDAIRRTIERSQQFGPAAPDVPKAVPAGRTAVTPAPGPAAPAGTAPRRTTRPVQDTAPLFATERMFYDQDKDPDFPPERTKSKNAKKKDTRGPGDLFFTLLILLFSVLLLVSGGLLVKRYFDDRKVQDDFSDLQAQMPTPAADANVSGGVATPDPNRFAALQAQNAECVGWISIEYTDLSYPVMYSPTRPNFYLKHGFQGEYSDYGVPYLDEDCTLTAESRSNNLIVYGHNMKTGIIFGPLTGYLQKDFYTVHPTVHLETLYDSSDYEVFAAFEIDVVQEPDFVYNEYHDMDEKTFDWFVNEVISRSPVDSGIRPVYGDDLLTLSTCEYTTDNGRLVVCARRVSAGAA